MAEKKTFVLRIDEQGYRVLEKCEADGLRGVNGQIEWILQTQLKSAGRLKTDLPAGSSKSKK